MFRMMLWSGRIQSFFHLAAAAFLAISDRRFGVSFSARVTPPLMPPNLPF